MEWINETWAQITSFGISGGTLVLLTWNTFVSSRLGSKRVDRLLDFTTVAHKTFSNVGELVSKSLSTFKSELMNSVVSPLQEQLKVEKEEKSFWQNIAVSAIAVANVPMNQKEAMYEMAKKGTQLSQEATKILEQSIANDKLIIEQAKQSNDNLSQDINEV